MVGRSDEARTSHTQTLEMGRGPGTWDWDCQTSEHLLLELDVGERTIQVRASEHALRVHAMGARLSVVCSALLWFNDAPHAALVLGRLAG